MGRTPFWAWTWDDVELALDVGTSQGRLHKPDRVAASESFSTFASAFAQGYAQKEFSATAE